MLQTRVLGKLIDLLDWTTLVPFEGTHLTNGLKHFLSTLDSAFLQRRNISPIRTTFLATGFQASWISIIYSLHKLHFSHACFLSCQLIKCIHFSFHPCQWFYENIVKVHPFRIVFKTFHRHTEYCSVSPMERNTLIRCFSCADLWVLFSTSWPNAT